MFQQIVSVSFLYQAWRKVRANRGAAGIDSISLQTFESDLMANLQELSLSLLSRSYQPLPARFVTIEKPNGKERELAILTVRDRVAQRAVLDAIEPIFERQFLDCNFAFRQGRNVEMAIQRMIAARANGYWWTVESDVQDFFGMIDRKLLLTEMSANIHDADVLNLLKVWLDAGALDPNEGSIFSCGLVRQGKEAFANLRLLLSESVNRSVDEYVTERLGVGSGYQANEWNNDAIAYNEQASFEEIQEAAQKQARREAFKRVIQDGALLALSNRALLGKFLGLKVLGIGGLAIAAATMTPKLINAYRSYSQPQIGTLQGSPVSPLLTNIYMTPFDLSLTRSNFRLVRYCDDFVIQCRTKEEASMALEAAKKALANRRLEMHPDKTRIVAPDEEFEFLGYGFAADGRVIPHPTVSEQVAQKIKMMARRAVRSRGEGKG